MTHRLPLRHVIMLLAAAAPAGAQCQDDKLVAADAAPGDLGGISVGFSGNVAVIGAEFDDDNGANSGSLYVFERGIAGWTETAKLIPADNDFDDRFGFAVDVSGDTIIGASRYNQDLGYGTGSLYFFERSGGVWTEVAKLLPLDAANGALFGASLAIDGTRVVVGASSANLPGALNCGVAYVFHRISGTWVEVAKLVAPSPATGDRFGDRVSISGDTILVSAVGDDDLGSAAGAAYVYEYDGLAWNYGDKLKASDGAKDDRFSIGLAVSGGELLVGSLRDGTAGVDSGATYAFQKQGGVWTEYQKLEPADSSTKQFFGASVDLQGSQAVIGAWGDDAAATNQGAVYHYELVAGTWIERAKLSPDDSQAGKHYGYALGLDGDTAMVGARGDDTAGTVAGALYSVSLSGTSGGDLAGCPGVVSVASGGRQELTLLAGAGNAGDFYLVLGSASGSLPGTLSGAGVVPLNWDAYMAFTLGSANTPLLASSFGVLDSAGAAQAAFFLPAASSPQLAGVLLNHAYVTLDVATLQAEYVSRAVPLRLIP